MPQYQICIDGYAACGKSTLARGLADELGFLYIDSGAMYRGVTLYFLNHDISFESLLPDSQLEDIEIEFEYVPQSVDILYLNGRNVSHQLRIREVNENVSKVASMSNVRRRMVFLQQMYGYSRNVVMDGRDIGTVVFPDAVLKLFLTATLETRINRRLNDEKTKGQMSGYDRVKYNLMERDRIDTTREDSPLKQAPDAVLFDNTNLTVVEQLAMTLELAKMRIYPD